MRDVRDRQPQISTETLETTTKHVLRPGKDAVIGRGARSGCQKPAKDVDQLRMLDDHPLVSTGLGAGQGDGDAVKTRVYHGRGAGIGDVPPPDVEQLAEAEETIETEQEGQSEPGATEVYGTRRHDAGNRPRKRGIRHRRAKLQPPNEGHARAKHLVADGREVTHQALQTGHDLRPTDTVVSLEKLMRPVAEEIVELVERMRRVTVGG